ncbi:tetratricopeptide repeat protein [Horticoccus sp. 23ND18S-11]|uniref:tetratricopeptide repeat protein n=1 Tax=Horticoccus sp. 23ND18S-11 TaxID=3391832 RepID=UPI0039C934B5
MQLSQESYRTRWLVLVGVWTLIGAALFSQARIIRDYLDVVGQLGSRGGAPASAPLMQAYPAFAADAQVWVRHALTLIEGDQIQLRYTTIDNAPAGREVHWNSAWAWAIAGAGKIHHLFTGQPITASVEKATIWLTPFTLFALVVIISSWATRHAGLIAGVVVAVAMGCHDRIFEGFFPSYVDHHGLLTVAVLGMVFGAVCMGGGWWQEPGESPVHILADSPARARKAAGFSAICGACGLWVSAASTIPPIAIVGIAGLLATLLHGKAALEQGSRFDPQVWRHWGRVGGAVSLFFYLLEYFPFHLGVRLEPNHPFHALAWFGAGELIAEISERSLRPAGERWTNLKVLIWPLLAVAVAPVTMIVGGAKVIAFIDPFMARLHSDYIQEFLPLWRTLRIFDAKGVFQLVVVANVPLLLGVATLSFRRRENPIVLWFATIATFFFMAMAWWQSRWLLNSTGIQISLGLLLLAIWTTRSRAWVRWTAALAMVGVLYVPTSLLRLYSSRADVAARRVAPRDAGAALNRDIAAALRNSQPTGEITLLSSPNASTGIGYYGRFKTLGTLYWENTSGLKAAAAILGARTEAEAARLIKVHGVTHVAIVADENFIEQYFRLLNPKATNDEVRSCFGLKLLMDRTVPQWLQMIPYRIPDDLRSLNANVMLFKVNFDQNVFQAMYNVALTQIANEAIDDADRTLDALIKQVPQAYEPWLRKGELLIQRRNFEAAAEHLFKGISLAPANDRTTLYIASAGLFYGLQRHADAIRFYRAGLAEGFHPSLAIYLAWILSTSSFDDVRNGREALELAQAALKTDPNSATYLNGVAAALAELGRYQEALSIMDQAVASATIRNEAALLRDSQERIALYRSQKPLRK